MARVLVVVVCSFQAAAAQSPMELKVLSSRPDMVTDGTALVEVKAGPGAHWHVFLNGVDVTQAFKPGESSDRAIALLERLPPGKSSLELKGDGKGTVKLSLLNHSASEPLFSGPRQTPFICQTEENGLGPALDKECSAKTVVEYYYRSTEPPTLAGREAYLAKYDSIFSGNAKTLLYGFKPLDPSKPRPSDIATVQLPDGRKVPYIVRREVGVINRAIYRIEFLHEPGEALPTPWGRGTSAWNGRMVYAFGGGCGAGYHQGALRLGEYPQFSKVIGQGYALVSSSLNILGNTCNDKVSAETAARVKEYFIKRFGAPFHTIGTGESGGGASVYLIAQNYPGILDGIIPFWAAPDIVSLTMVAFSDCTLLDRAMAQSSRSWAEAQKSAVSGFASWRACEDRPAPPAWLDPAACDASMPKNLIYDRNRNPKGVRCTYYDNAVNVFGRDEKTGFARRTLDNVGVQYGLAALNAGVIDAEQFIELNQHVGGFDIDGQLMAARSEADPKALRMAYERGELVTGKSLSNVPIIDWNPYLDDLDNLHTRDWALTVRTHLQESNGNADNQIILVTPRPAYGGQWSLNPKPPAGAGLDTLVPIMDRWLARIAADPSAASLAEKIVRNKPTDLADGCVATDGRRIAEPATFKSTGLCNQLYPVHANPRVVAGAPPGADILKCWLKPLDPADYKVAMTSEQLQRLKVIFPTGVCDYTRPATGRGTEPLLWNKLN